MGKLATLGRSTRLYLILCMLAALSPLFRADSAPLPARFPGWPSEIDGRPLTRVEDTAEELEFYERSAVRHARFVDGRRTVLLRWVDSEPAGFHLADACFRAYGYALGPYQDRDAAGGRRERCYVATRAQERLEVCEHIRDARDRTFTSTEAWRLADLLGGAEPPFWGVSVVTPLDRERR